MQRVAFVLFFCFSSLVELQAAAPKMDLLFPAGGARGTTVTVTVSGALDPWPVQIWSNRPELQFKPLEEKGKISITIPADCPVGRCWVRLFNAEGGSTARPFIIGSLPEMEEAEPNNELNQAQPMTGQGIVVNGKHQASNDVDVYSITLKAGQVLVADLEAHRSLGSPADPVLQILSDQGFVLDQNDDDQDLDPRIVFTAPKDGQYRVRTFAFPAQTDSSIHFSGGANWIYRLTLTTGGFVDHVMPLVATRATNSEVVAVGENLGAESLKIAVAGQDADRLAVSGPQFGNVLSLNSVTWPVLAELEPNSAAQPQSVPVPIGISGTITAIDDTDAFRFPAKKGQPLQISVLARKLGSPIDPVLLVLDATGKQMQRVDDQGDNRDPEITWNPPAEGEYVVRIEDLHGRSGSRFYYHVSIVPPEPDFRLSVTADTFILPVDKPLEIPVTIDRLAGFKGEIDVTILGLPAGVVAAPVKSPGEGDSAKSVKLMVTGNAAPFSGPIQISARTTAEPFKTRTARFILEGFNADTNQFWLTVIKK